jgi:hypothetical protein
VTQQRGMVPFPVSNDLERDHPHLVEATSVFLHKLTYDVPMQVYNNKARLDQVVVTFRNEGRGWLVSVTARGWTSPFSQTRKRRSDIFAGRHLLAKVAQEAVDLALNEVGLLPDDVMNLPNDGRLWQESDQEPE